MSTLEGSESQLGARSVRPRSEAEVLLTEPAPGAAALVMDVPALIETIYSHIPLSARCGPAMLSRLAVVSRTFKRFSEDEALWMPIAHQCLPLTGVATADEKVVRTRDALARRLGGYRRLVLAYARANGPQRGVLLIQRPRRFSFAAEQAASTHQGVYLLFEVFDRLQNRVVASSGGWMSLGQDWERPNSSDSIVQHLTLQPDGAALYQAPPQSMRNCRFWMNDADFSLDFTPLLNELSSPKDWIMGRVYAVDPSRGCGNGLFVLWESIMEGVPDCVIPQMHHHQMAQQEATFYYACPWSPLALTGGVGCDPLVARLSLVLRWVFTEQSYSVDPSSLRLELGLPPETSWSLDLVRTLERGFASSS